MKKVLLIFMLLLSLVSVAQVVSDEVMASWAFEANPKTTYLRDFCLGSTTPEQAEYQSVRAVWNKQNEAKVRLRFTLGKEVYQSVAEAEVAMDEINNPTQSSSKQAKMCDIRQAFKVDHVVYFVHTDVGNFKPELSNILEKLNQYVQ